MDTVYFPTLNNINIKIQPCSRIRKIPISIENPLFEHFKYINNLLYFPFDIKFERYCFSMFDLKILNNNDFFKKNYP